MTNGTGAVDAFWTTIETHLSDFNLLNLIDIVIVALIFFKVIEFVLESRALTLVQGIVLIVILLQLSDFLNLDATNYLLINTLQVGLIAVLIVFQPELRRALEQVGRGRLSFGLFSQGSGDKELISKMIDGVSASCKDFSEQHVGALIVFERTSTLEDVAQTGTQIDAVVTKELIESIFFEKNPLHDGAVIISKGRILSAACILPLTANKNLSKELGTRHRAAIGISEYTDAVVVVVSEETGKISIVQDGHIRRGLKYDSLRETLLKTLLIVEEKKVSKTGAIKNSIIKFFGIKK